MKESANQANTILRNAELLAGKCAAHLTPVITELEEIHKELQYPNSRLLSSTKTEIRHAVRDLKEVQEAICVLKNKAGILRELSGADSKPHPSYVEGYIAGLPQALLRASKSISVTTHKTEVKISDAVENLKTTQKNLISEGYLETARHCLNEAVEDIRHVHSLLNSMTELAHATEDISRRKAKIDDIKNDIQEESKLI